MARQLSRRHNNTNNFRSQQRSWRRAGWGGHEHHHPNPLQPVPLDPPKKRVQIPEVPKILGAAAAVPGNVIDTVGQVLGSVTTSVTTEAASFTRAICAV